MTELRRQVDEDMIVRRFAARTREAYLWAVTGLAKYMLLVVVGASVQRSQRLPPDDT